MWWLLVALGILSTFGPAPGSIEGLVFTVIPISIRGYVEVVPQALLLSAGLFYWVKHSDRRWLNWVLGIAFFVALLLPALGLFLAPGS
jgi:hypothetical protein